ncbi:hypothetical protein [Meiothermus ruber]|jgi:transposase|uniref:Transposase n=1 Tax=Meiothermus ruber (strain ATCC 35948 / DSM 1279 / VKM B-1258 / 21) TaxID=504728 RepID=M9X719_MEIRD|nr:hypothetical protein [Meiothermus ruber]AGK05087.1 hypothetical protein K649_08960 [Meiothermus ruber DSM 1279]MCL6529327.1 hypothetical protein [Meiothermus ruber]GAO76385.1 IS4 family Transposase [Meiothermus ruber H328]GIW32296.1 MAG: hypothetical protein KatS3mg071_2470 [Meiothermus sp.]
MELRESRYPSDLTDQEWAILAPLMPQPSASSPEEAQFTPKAPVKG